MFLTVAAENMNAEAAYILKNKASIADADQFLADVRNQSMRVSERQHKTASYQEHYQNVSQENIELLREIYKNDIYIFGYPDTPFVDFERS